MPQLVVGSYRIDTAPEITFSEYRTIDILVAHFTYINTYHTSHFRLCVGNISRIFILYFFFDLLIFELRELTPNVNAV